MRLKAARLSLDEIVRPPLEQFQLTDPSEAVRSGEILSVLDRFFDVRSLLRLGGTLAQPLFTRTVANYLADSEGPVWAERILADEREAVRSGRLASDFVALWATPRPEVA